MGIAGGPCFDNRNRIIGLAASIETLGSVEAYTRNGRLQLDFPANYGYLVPIEDVMTLVEGLRPTSRW